MKKAFTIFELIVAMALIVVLLAGSGLVFRMSVEVHSKAMATAEISRKLLAIVQQLDQDFENLRKDGEIIMMWLPRYDSNLGRYVRFDRIMFFATGDFHSYGDNPSVQGNMARISYMLAKDGKGNTLWSDDPQKRIPPKDGILARVQHVYTADASLDVFPDLSDMPLAAAPYSYTEIEENSVEYD
ncbi:MAG: prepilin-type N-terminal cleavage/methylation domain-containing protein, partial [Planctomycetes bacterium]|nr:prepilin-type N-terminal cleavage/methylation domain-containing protein [Planctomycetota bacterium]